MGNRKDQNPAERSNKKTNTKIGEKRATARMTAVGVAGNVVLAVFKLVAGIFGHSSAMVSDAVHTLSDIFATLIAFIGVTLSRKAADDEHPYGHDRLECVASVLLAVILFATGAAIGLGCIRDIVTGAYKEAEPPAVLAIVAAAVSIAVKEAMFWYTMYYARKYESGVFKADAWHHRSDALSSVGALAGIIGARLGLPVLDPVAGILICVVILIVAIRIFRDAVSKMLDTSCDEAYERELSDFVVRTAAEKKKQVGVDLIRTRKFGEKIYVELEISMDGEMRLKESHDVAEYIHDAVERKDPHIKHVIIHVNPAGYQYDVPKKL